MPSIPIRALMLALIVAAFGRAEETYLFSYFTSNGQDGLHLAYSHDGYAFQKLKDGASFLKPDSGLMRDPSITRGPDGVFHMTWTTGIWKNGIGYARSTDLINWSAQKAIPVMEHEPEVRNCWAPEIFHDDAQGRFLIVWSSTIPGRFPETDNTGDDGLNHRMYYVTTVDFETFSETRLFYDDGFNVIDGFIARDKDRYVLFLKDETRKPKARKDIRMAYAGSAEGPYGPASPPFTTTWVEGPSAIKIKDEWFVYYDEYTRKRYGAVKSKDLVNWETITDKIKFPKGARHGTVFAVEGFKINESRPEGFEWEPYASTRSLTDLGDSGAKESTSFPFKVRRDNGVLHIPVSAAGPYGSKVLNLNGRFIYSESPGERRR